MTESERKSVTPEAARLRMASLCSTREVCEFEIRAKLLRMHLPDSEIEKILDFLVENKFVDNARYARAFASDKARFSGWGRQKIAMGLRQKRISASHIAMALDGLDHDIYAQSLLKAARSGASSLDLEQYGDRAKLARRLASRGFESGLIMAVIEQLRREGARGRE